MSEKGRVEIERAHTAIIDAANTAHETAQIQSNGFVDVGAFVIGAMTALVRVVRNWGRDQMSIKEQDELLMQVLAKAITRHQDAENTN